MSCKWALDRIDHRIYLLKVEEVLENSPLILIVSKEPQLADARASVLEAAGYVVVSAMNLKAVRKTLEAPSTKFALIIIGYSLPPPEQRRVWLAAKKSSEAPVLQLFKDGRHELLDTNRTFERNEDAPADFITAVNLILRSESRPGK